MAIHSNIKLFNFRNYNKYNKQENSSDFMATTLVVYKAKQHLSYITIVLYSVAAASR